MSKREVPMLNKDNFVTWQSLMKLHLGAIGDYAKSSLGIEHVDPTSPLTIDDLNKRKEQNQAMLEIASTLSYVEFDDVKGCDTTFKMSKALSYIYGGDHNVQKTKR